MRTSSTRFALTALMPLLLLCALSCSPEEQGGGTPPIVKLHSTELSADGGSVWVSVAAEGKWSISLTYSDNGGWASVDPSSWSGTKSDVRLRCEPNGGESSRSVTLVVDAAGGSSSATLTQLGTGGHGSADLLVNGFDKAPYAWLELPATAEGDGLTFFVHDMEGGKYVNAAQSGVRNWSFYWDAKEHLSLWVAYPLNNKLKGSGSRSNAWGLDPLLPASAQPDLTGGSYGGGWTRGHQLPSADRLTFKANVSTFYGTNMTPQQYDFNGEIWASLEGKVRAYAALADTLYVATGCLYRDSGLRTGTSSGFSVVVPTHYFKALLFKGSSTYTVADGYMAAGFLLPHDEAIRKDNCLNYIMSIDDLEQRTGIDFFPCLSALIGRSKADAVESAAPSAWWK